MYTCKPAKRSIIFLYIILFALGLLLTYLTCRFEVYLGEIAGIILFVIWFAELAFMLILLPMYYKQTRIYVSDQEVTKYTFMFTYKYQYMSMNSVKSVTTFISPFGKYTGLNFIIVNALGSRMLLPLLGKNDCREISYFFNDIISGRIEK